MSNREEVDRWIVNVFGEYAIGCKHPIGIDTYYYFLKRYLSLMIGNKTQLLYCRKRARDFNSFSDKAAVIINLDTKFFTWISTVKSQRYVIVPQSRKILQTFVCPGAQTLISHQHKNVCKIFRLCRTMFSLFCKTTLSNLAILLISRCSFQQCRYIFANNTESWKNHMEESIYHKTNKGNAITEFKTKASIRARNLPLEM